jgi:hypothetical protein
MNVDHLIEHLTEPSTIRGIIWTAGASLALLWIHKGDYEGALQVITQTGLAVGAVGMLTREKPCDNAPDDGGDGDAG